MLRQGSFVGLCTWICVGEWHRLVSECKTQGCSRTSEIRSERRGALNPVGIAPGQRTVCASGEAMRDIPTRVLAHERGGTREREREGVSQYQHQTQERESRPWYLVACPKPTQRKRQRHYILY